MGHYIARRLIYLVVVLLVVSAITFILMHAVPGGPFDQEKRVPPEILANLNRRYHLDEPLPVQYARYLYDVILPHFTTTPAKNTVDNDFLVNFRIGKLWVQWMNFGPTYSSRSRTVNDIFRQQLPVSMQLGIMALFLAIATGVPLGIMAALKQNTIFDYLGMSLAIFGVCVPVIVLGPMLVWIFAVMLKVLPASGWGSTRPSCSGFSPNVGLGLLQVCHLASCGSWPGQLGDYRPVDLRHPAPGGARRLHPHGASQRPAGAAGDHPPRPEKFADPGDHHPWPAVCRPGDRHICHRADFWHPRHGQVFCHQHHQP